MSEGGPVSDRQAMLAGMAPALDERAFRFVCRSPADGGSAQFQHIFAIVREAEGTTFVVASEEAAQAGHDGPDFACVTLQVHSDLEGVGLTAAVSSALADSDIACNIVAGFHHDHLFVPWHRRHEALAILGRLSEDARR